MSKINERLKMLNLPENVEETANNIYSILPVQIRSSKRVDQIVYLITSEAYKTNKILYDPKELKKQLKISKPNDILKFAARNGYQPVIVHYLPQDCFESFCHHIGIKYEKHKEELHSLLEVTLKYFPFLHEKTPQSVAGGVIAFFATIHSYKFNIEEFAAKTKLSKSIIKSVKDNVSDAYAIQDSPEVR